MNDFEWMQAFESSTLPNESFHHADHVKMAFLYLQKYPPLEALGRFSSALTRFATRASAPQNWAEFSAANPDLLLWKDNILKKYYRPETLTSELARTVFLFPDKQPSA